MHGLLLLSDERNWPCHRSRGGPQGPLYHECALYSKLFIFETPGLILYSKPFISKLICLIILYTLNTTTGNDQRCKKDESARLLVLYFLYLYSVYLYLYFCIFAGISGTGIAQKCESLAPSAPVESLSQRIHFRQDTECSKYFRLWIHRNSMPQDGAAISIWFFPLNFAYGEIDIFGRWTIMHQNEIFINPVIVNWLFIEELENRFDFENEIFRQYTCIHWWF